MRGDLKVGWLCGLDGGEIPKRGPLWGGALWVEAGGLRLDGAVLWVLESIRGDFKVGSPGKGPIEVTSGG